MEISEGDDPCLCAKDVAVLLGVSERTAARLMSAGEIEAFRIRRLWRTTRDRVEAYKLAGFDRYRRSPPKAG